MEEGMHVAAGISIILMIRKCLNAFSVADFSV